MGVGDLTDLDRKPMPVQLQSGIWRRFGDLRVRPKLIVLHNLFFLVLSTAVYFTVIPAMEQRVANAKALEIRLIGEIFSGTRPPSLLQHLETYDYREGSAQRLQIPSEVKQWLDAHPGEVWLDQQQSDFMYRKDAETGLYRRITLPNLLYDDVVNRAKITLFLVLGTIYVLAVLLLELMIMPRYVYQPLRLMLDADEATRQGDRNQELIAEPFIPGDEIGQIMRSRNETIHNLRRNEDELKQALAKIEAQDRLASLGLLSASVAHEMNTPLAVLQGSIEKLLETVLDKTARERLERMLHVTMRLRKISESLLDFARVRRQAMETVALRPLIHEAWNLVAIDEKAGKVNFTSHVSAEAAVIGNPDRLMQVFVNLLRNSLHVVEESGHITVQSHSFQRENRTWISTMVDDDGPGIPPDVLPLVFDAFVSSRLDSRGTGLGLTVAQGIVEQHGGTIHAMNRSRGGARIEVILQAAEGFRAISSARP
jgi:signal transduction histidine kinase